MITVIIVSEKSVKNDDYNERRIEWLDCMYFFG